MGATWDTLIRLLNTILFSCLRAGAGSYSWSILQGINLYIVIRISSYSANFNLCACAIVPLHGSHQVNIVIPQPPDKDYSNILACGWISLAAVNTDL